MLRRLGLYTLVLCSLLPWALAADQITLKNGDHLTGTVVKGDGKTLVLHTDSEGDLTIQFSAIQDIKTDQQLHISMKGGQTVVGPVTSNEGKLEIATKTGTVAAAPVDITLIRNDAEQVAYEKTLHPGWEHGWTGGINLGFSVARGNSETENIALAFNAVHTTLNDKLTLGLNSINTQNQLATPSTVANLIDGSLRYDHNINPKIFVFGEGDFMSNALQYLDLRQLYTGGLGWHAINNPNTTLDILGGVNYTHETYSNGAPVTPPTIPPTFVSYGMTNRFVALMVGDNLSQKLGKSTALTEALTFLPNLQNTGQYQFTFNLGTVTKIKSWLGWQNQFTDIYASNPPVGTKKNDILLTTGLNISFTH